MLGGPNTARHWMGRFPHSVLSPHWRRWVSLFIKMSILPGLLPHPQPLSPHFFSCLEHRWHQWLLFVFEGESHQGCAGPTMPTGVSFWGALSQAQQQEVSSLQSQPHLLDHLVSLDFSCYPTPQPQPTPCLLPRWILSRVSREKQCHAWIDPSVFLLINQLPAGTAKRSHEQFFFFLKVLPSIGMS